MGNEARGWDGDHISDDIGAEHLDYYSGCGPDDPRRGVSRTDPVPQCLFAIGHLRDQLVVPVDLNHPEVVASDQAHQVAPVEAGDGQVVHQLEDVVDGSLAFSLVPLVGQAPVGGLHPQDGHRVVGKDEEPVGVGEHPRPGLRAVHNGGDEDGVSPEPAGRLGGDHVLEQLSPAGALIVDEVGNQAQLLAEQFVQRGVAVQPEGGGGVGPAEAGSTYLQPPVVVLGWGEGQYLGIGGKLQGRWGQESSHWRCSPVGPAFPIRARLLSMFGGCCPWPAGCPSYVVANESCRASPPSPGRGICDSSCRGGTRLVEGPYAMESSTEATDQGVIHWLGQGAPPVGSVCGACHHRLSLRRGG